VAAALGGNVSSRLSQGGFDDPSEQSVQAANVLASRFHNGSDNIILLGGVVEPPLGQAGRDVSTQRRGHDNEQSGHDQDAHAVGDDRPGQAP